MTEYKRKTNNQKKNNEFRKTDYIVADNTNFTLRKWSITVCGNDLEDAVCRSFDRICILNQGHIRVPIYYKQLNNVEKGKNNWEEIPQDTINIAVLVMRARALGHDVIEECDRRSLLDGMHGGIKLDKWKDECFECFGIVVNSICTNCKKNQNEENENNV